MANIVLETLNISSFNNVPGHRQWATDHCSKYWTRKAPQWVQWITLHNTYML